MEESDKPADPEGVTSDEPSHPPQPAWDVASTVSWLCSDEADYITGQCIGMNGGELPW